MYACLPKPDVGRGDDQVGDLLLAEVFDEHRHGVEVIDRDLEEPLDLRAVQVHGQDPVGPGGLDAIGTDAGPDRDPGLVLLVALGVGEEGDDRRDLGGAGALERVDPEEQLDEVVVDRVIGPLDDEDVAAADVLEHADEDVPFAEDVRLRPRELDSQVAADRLSQRGARTAGEDLQLAVGVGPLRRVVTADQRLVHGHGGRPADRVRKSRKKRVGTFSDHLAPTVDAITHPESTTSYLNKRQGHSPAGQPSLGSATAKATAPALDPLPFSAASVYNAHSGYAVASHSRSLATLRVSGMTRHLSSRRRLLVALGLLAFFGLTFVALFPGFFSKLRRLPDQDHSAPIQVQLASFRQDAEPSLEGGVGWINSGPIDLAQLKGKIVLLDFWTYCCINCHHVLPTLAKLEEKYKNELVVIGVHSGKFNAERNTENIRRKVAEYRIKHPVVNDANMVIWERFQVSSWPTLVLITPDGKFAGQRRGEIPFEDLDRVIGQVATKFKDQLNLKPLEFPAENDRAAQGPLLFPGKVLADPAGSGCSSPTPATTGSSRPTSTANRRSRSARAARGSSTATIDKARFNRPQGMCLDGETLYVADTENHAIRAVDLKPKQ